jgi:hypothetical protein
VESNKHCGFAVLFFFYPPKKGEISPSFPASGCLVGLEQYRESKKSDFIQQVAVWWNSISNEKAKFETGDWDLHASALRSVRYLFL